MHHTINDVLRTTTKDYLASLDKDNPPDPATLEYELLEIIASNFAVENNNEGDRSRHWKIPQKLEFQQIAEIIATLYPVCKIPTADEVNDTSYDILAIYQSDGPNQGIYVTSDEIFRSLARSYNYKITKREFEEMMTTLQDIVPRRTKCHEPNLIAVNNGIFDYDTKQLLPFSPEYIFMTKSRVNYNPNAVNPIIHNNDDGTDWDVESWMHSLSDDDEVVNTLWEVLGAIIRPNVAWNKSAWFYSETGNNGKGTLCELMRQLCGDGSHTSIPLSDMGKDFMLEPLLNASAIIVDENDVGTFIDKAANLKAIITNDVIQINRKFKTPLPFRFHGFMIQCLNEMPRIKDKSDSFFRRQLFIPFDKCFTGAERKYIKNDYLHRKEVLEYVLHRVLHMNYYTLQIPAYCEKALAEYKEYNDPLLQFKNDILPQCRWDLLPFTFLHDLYREWFKRNIPSGTPLSHKPFTNGLIMAIKDDPIWVCPSKDKQWSPMGRIMVPEPLIYEYHLSTWMHTNASSYHDIDKICTPNNLLSSYRGLVRKDSLMKTVKKGAK